MQSPATHSMSTESLIPALPLLTTSVTGSSESPFKLPRFFAPTLYNDTAEIAGESFIVLAADFTRLYFKHCQTIIKLVQEDQWTKVGVVTQKFSMLAHFIKSRCRYERKLWIYGTVWMPDTLAF